MSNFIDFVNRNFDSLNSSSNNADSFNGFNSISVCVMSVHFQGLIK